MKKIKLFEEFAVNESSKFKVKDIKIGTILNFKDGETWKVTGFIGKPNDPRGVFASPFGKTTDSYTSIALEFTIAELEKGVKSLDESMVVEAKDFTKMALEILGDISQEFDPWEIRDMLPQDAEDTVDAYYPKWNSADKKKLAKELMNYADQPGQWITEAEVSESLTERTYNSSKEIAIYDGEDGLTYIEKRGKGYYGYNDEFDFEAEDKAELEKKLKSWKYKLISGSIDESVDVEVVEVFKYTEDDINMQYGFYGTLENHYDEKKVQKMYLTAIKDLMKAYRVSEESAIKILDSREGRHFADFIIDGMVKNVVDAIAKFFGSGARVFNFINTVSEDKEYNESSVVLDGSWVDTKELNWVDHTRVIKWIHNELDNKATMTKDGKGWSIDTSKLLPRQLKNLIEYLRSQKFLKEAHNVTEAKTMDRDDMMVHLEDKYRFGSVRPTEEFDGAQGGIWVSGENGEALGGKRIYDYYASGSAYELGVLKKYEQAINKLGWYSEWYDAGTVMIWPI